MTHHLKTSPTFSISDLRDIRETAPDVVQARIEFLQKVVAVLSQVLRIYCVGVARKEPILGQQLLVILLGVNKQCF